MTVTGAEAGRLAARAEQYAIEEFGRLAAEQPAAKLFQREIQEVLARAFTTGWHAALEHPAANGAAPRRKR